MKRDQVDCWLLTGATGLVGRFVLAELLRAGSLVAALVRDRAAAQGAARIEESLLPFETEVALLRPRTIAFDLTVPGLGVSEEDRRWLAGKRLGVIHSAASIRFSATSPNDEPYLSNVVGTENLLQFLREFDVSCFHYVSTAYVTSRSVPAAESQLSRKEVAVEPGATGGNDYESSKIQSERLILDCPWLGSKTILRPSIIVGDSQTAYTSTFHGFYAPLQIGRQVVKLPGGTLLGGAWFRRQLGMKETDTKNFVPVDWVARAIVKVALDSRLHGQIYHLTNPHPVATLDVQTAIELALTGATSSDRATDPNAIEEAPTIPANFREQMAVYESYFNNDPKFDCTNTQRGLADLPCPRVDVELLVRLAKFALDANFGWPKPSVVLPSFVDAFKRLCNVPQLDSQGSAVVQLQTLGVGAPEPLSFAKIADRWQPVQPKGDMQATATIVGGASDFALCINGTQSLSELVACGRAVCAGAPTGGWANLLHELDCDLKHRN